MFGIEEIKEGGLDLNPFQEMLDSNIGMEFSLGKKLFILIFCILGMEDGFSNSQFKEIVNISQNSQNGGKGKSDKIEEK